MKDKSIALCLSGGGHRATVFALGALLYLVDAGLHRNIKLVLSVSGGSLTSGFLATRRTPFVEMSAEEAEGSIAQIAHQISGGTGGVVWPAGIAVVGLSLIWSLHLLGVVTWAPLWLSHLLFLGSLVALSLLLEKVCGGTFWGWWGTWIYLGLLFPSLIVGVAIWWSPLPWWACLGISVVSWSVPLLRCRIAEMAFAATLFRGRGHVKLAGLPSKPRFVFCATDAYSAQHALFTHDLIDVPLAGVGVPRHLTVTSAVQMSANFPVAFPYRFLWSSRYQFCLGDRQPLFLMLTDGGVADNMATSWLSRGPLRAARLARRLAKATSDGDCDAQRAAELPSQIAALGGDPPDTVIVVNSSEPYAWQVREQWTPPVKHLFGTIMRFLQYVAPIIGEARMLLRVTNAMYENLGLDQKNKVRRRFLSEPQSGALISIGDHPYDLLYTFARADHELDILLAQSGVDRKDVEGLVKKARQIVFGFEPPSGEERHLEEQWHQLLRQRRDLEHARYCRILTNLGLSGVASAQLGLESMKALVAQEHRRVQEDRSNTLDAVRLIDDEKSQLEDLELLRRIGEIGERKTRLASERINTGEARKSRRLGDSSKATWRAVASAGVATTFRPLGKDATTMLIAHAYQSAMANCHLFLDWPFWEELPQPEDFGPLAEGMRRTKRPRAMDARPQDGVAVP